MHNNPFRLHLLRQRPRTHDVNMLEGSPFLKILSFSLPLMLTSLLQALYNAADMMVVSFSTAPDAVDTVGATAPFLNMILNLFVGFSAGANVVASRHKGAGDEGAVSRTVHTSVVMALIFGVAGAAVGLALARPVLVAMGTSGSFLSLGFTYCAVYLSGLPFLALTNYASALLNAKGDTRTPLAVLAFTGILNVGLNFLFVLGLGMTVEGVALATVIANAVSAALLLFRLSRAEGPFHFSWRRLRLEKIHFFEILHIGVPAGIQGALFSFSNILVQSSLLRVNDMMTPAGAAYAPVMKGSGAAGNVEAFAYAAVNSVYSASITFTSCHVGAKKYRRIPRVMLSCLLATTLLSGLTSGAILLFRKPLLALYDIGAVSTDPLSLIALEAAEQRMFYTMGGFLLIAYMDVAAGVLRGLGSSLAAMLISLGGVCALRVVWLYTVFAAAPGLSTLYMLYPVTWGTTFLVMMIADIIILRRKIRQQKVEKE